MVSSRAAGGPPPGWKVLEELVREWTRVLGREFPLLSREDLATLRKGPARSAPHPRPRGQTAPPGDELEELHQEVRECRRCGLGRACRNHVPGEGPRNPLFMFVGEGPGAEEDRLGRPFVGPSGRLLTAMIEKGIGIPRFQVYITNVVKCRPPGDRDPTPEEAAACRTFLERQVRLVAPKVLVALGRVAATALLGTRLPLHVLRGKPKEFQGIPLVLTWHPAYLLRYPEAKREAWEDLKLAMSLAGLRPGGPSQRIR